MAHIVPCAERSKMKINFKRINLNSNNKKGNTMKDVNSKSVNQLNRVQCHNSFLENECERKEELIQRYQKELYHSATADTVKVAVDGLIILCNKLILDKNKLKDEVEEMRGHVKTFGKLKLAVDKQIELLTTSRGRIHIDLLSIEQENCKLKATLKVIKSTILNSGVRV